MSARKEHLKGLAEEFGVPVRVVFQMASLLGPSEDYDGLVTSLSDYADSLEDEEYEEFMD